jgi:hypothetical protein
MDSYKKILGQILIVTGGVALYMLAVKPLMDKASIGK